VGLSVKRGWCLEVGCEESRFRGLFLIANCVRKEQIFALISLTAYLSNFVTFVGSRAVMQCRKILPKSP
jgi:hypothetical protein